MGQWVRTPCLVAGTTLLLSGVCHGQGWKLDGPVDPARIAVRLAPGANELDLEWLLEVRGKNPREIGILGSYAYRVVEVETFDSIAAQHDFVRELVDDPRIDYATPVFVSELGLPEYPTRSLLVRFEPSVSRGEQLAALARFASLEIVEDPLANMENAYLLESSAPSGMDVLEVARELARLPGVAWAEPNRATTIVYTDCDATDFLYPELWGLENTGQNDGVPGIDLNVSDAWCFERGDPSIIVVVLDSGVQTDHPDINTVSGADFTDHPLAANGDPVDECDNHGTPVAGVITGKIDNLEFVDGHGPGHLVGVAPGCRVAPARISNAGAGPCVENIGGTEYLWIINALDWAVQIGARVTNSSFQLPPDPALGDKYDDTELFGGLVHFGATGNSGTRGIYFPASQVSVNAVGALMGSGQRWPDSTYGPGIFCIAPGHLMNLQDRDGGAGYNSPSEYLFQSAGTSYSSPHVAGVAALLLSADPTLQPTEVEGALANTARDGIYPGQDEPGYDERYGWGLPDATAAMQVVADGAGIVYVDASGGLGGNGTLTAPFVSVGAGVTLASPGGRVIVRVGSYDESLTLSSAVVMEAAGGAVLIGQ